MNKQTYAIAERIQNDDYINCKTMLLDLKSEKTYRTFNEYFIDLVAGRERTGVNLVNW